MSESENAFEWIEEKVGEVFQAVDEEGISREEARGRIRKVLEEFEAKLLEMIPKEVFSRKAKKNKPEFNYSGGVSPPSPKRRAEREQRG